MKKQRIKQQLLSVFCLSISFLFSCTGSKPITSTSKEITTSTTTKQQVVPLYQKTKSREIDVLHTKLMVDVNWENKQLNGEAYLTIKPYYFSLDTVVLDAKAMTIEKVILLSKNKELPIEAINTGKKLKIPLPYRASKMDTIDLYIKYIANPEKVTQKGSSAISMAKGLYFINAKGSNSNKPQQLWTQGETEANSVWFPTIDSPVEKTTQELFITVEDRFKTLSNGELIYSSLSEDGFRTDYWKMEKPHSPYLFMMAIGEFSIVEDYWKKDNGEVMDVFYFVDPKYESHAKAIFGKTPKMLTYFSKILGFEYPWNKYHQVVVEDFVSGAMENTTATIHGDFLHQTKREIIDGGNESIIAHELFHHWFGDLVTCESWSNLPLNESFANYSQYLWDEYEYGKMEADMNAFQEMEGYFLSAQQAGYKDLIRFDFLDKEDMFDGHSYNKGGRILHMLRDYLGDDAFFDGLNLYLTTHAYQTAEAHDLRIAFEKVSGLDLNWFFNQWFYAKGHPVLEIKQDYSAEAKELKLMIHQKQDTENWPLYSLPIQIDIYTENGVEHYEKWITKKYDTTTYALNQQPLLVNVDAHKTLLCKKTDLKSTKQWIHQMLNAPLWLDKKEAIDKLAKSKEKEVLEAMLKMLHHDFWNVKLMVIRKIKNTVALYPEKVKTALLSLSIKDSSPKVRAAAIRALGKFYPISDDISIVIKKALKDSSYQVISDALKVIVKNDSVTGLKLAKGFEKEESSIVNQTVAAIYADYGNQHQHQFFLNTIDELSGFNKYSFLQQYFNYLLRQEISVIDVGVVQFEKIARHGKPWYLKLSGYHLLSAIKDYHQEKIDRYNSEIVNSAKENTQLDQLQITQSKKEHQKRVDYISDLLKELISEETNQEVLKYIGNK